MLLDVHTVEVSLQKPSTTDVWPQDVAKLNARFNNGSTSLVRAAFMAPRDDVYLCI